MGKQISNPNRTKRKNRIYSDRLLIGFLMRKVNLILFWFTSPIFAKANFSSPVYVALPVWAHLDAWSLNIWIEMYQSSVGREQSFEMVPEHIRCSLRFALQHSHLSKWTRVHLQRTKHSRINLHVNTNMNWVLTDCGQGILFSVKNNDALFLLQIYQRKAKSPFNL